MDDGRGDAAADDDVRDRVGADVDDAPIVGVRGNTTDPDFPPCSDQPSVQRSRSVGFESDSEVSPRRQAADEDSWWYQRLEADNQARDDGGGDGDD